MSGDLRKSIATFALAFLAGIVGAVFGWIVTGFAADAVLALPNKLEDLKIDLETKKNTMPGIWEGLGRRGKDGGREDNCFRQRRSLFPLVVAFPRVARAGSAGPALQAETREKPKSSPEFGPWQPLDFVDDDPNGEARKASPDEGHEIRYRIERND